MRCAALLAAVMVTCCDVAAAAPHALPLTFSTISAGGSFTCAVGGDDQHAYCWGAGGAGQLGTDAPLDNCGAAGPCALGPVPVAGENRFSSISAGADHVCAIDAANEAFCWGAGQRTPTRLPLHGAVRSIAAGDGMTCAVDEDGTWCWNVGSPAALTTPTRIPLDRPLDVVAAGGQHACGLTEDHQLRCWSWPEVIDEGVTTPSERTDWHIITVAARHACALIRTGRAFCWGSDADGALGIGPNAHAPRDDLPLTEVAIDRRFVRIVTGTSRTCAIDNADALYCWGRVPEAPADDRCLSSMAVAGTDDCTTHPIAVVPRTDFWAIAVGRSHQCGIVEGKSIVCWGANEAGQLGTGGIAGSSTPVAVRGSAASRLRGRLNDAQAWSGWLLRRGWKAVLFVLPLALIGVFVRRWWRTGEEFRRRAPADAPPGAKAAGLVACVLVALSSAAVASLFFASPPSGHDDVAFGLGMINLMIVGGAAMGVAAIAAMVALITLRRHPDVGTARIALVLAALVLLPGVLFAFALVVV